MFMWWGSFPQVNGERVSPPLRPTQGIKISLNSRYLQLTTDFGLTVRFDGNIQGGENKHTICANSYVGLVISMDTIYKTEQTHASAVTGQTPFP